MVFPLTLSEDSCFGGESFEPMRLEEGRLFVLAFIYDINIPS